MYKHKLINYTDSNPEGTQPAIVFLHGFFMDSRMFKHQVEYFKSEYRVICCDLRGFGQSDLGNTYFSLEDAADDISALLTHLNISKCVVAGMSMGGYIAQRLALKHPDLVSSLILIATQAAKDNAETVKSYLQLKDNWANVDIRSHIIESLLPIIIGGNENEVNYWRKVWFSHDVNTIDYSMRAMISRDDLDVSGIGVPALIIHGRCDLGIPLEAAKKLDDALLNSKMVVIDGACHAVNLTHPIIVNEAIYHFLNENIKQKRSKHCPADSLFWR